ncbi:MAG: nucleoside hydrolase [Planctomycetia bacterium]|nr:nucleoside hydrolase [Planctomycetia bacterium]
MARKIILDVDPGIADILALYFALYNAEIDLLGLTVCGGHSAPQAALRTVQAIIESLDPPRLPRLGVGSELSPTPQPTHRNFWNAQGMSALHMPTADYFSVHPAEKIISDIIRSHPNEVTIVALGPLTNIARAFAREKDLCTLTHRLIIVGGSILEPGNATPVAEFNFYRDAHAARQIFRCRAAKTLIPLDVTNKILIDYDVVKILPPEGTRLGDFLRDVIPHSLYLHRQYLGIEGMLVPGVVGLLSLLRPEMFLSKMLPGDVETDGELTRGMSVFDRRILPKWNANIDVATDIFASNIREEILKFLKSLGRI